MTPPSPVPSPADRPSSAGRLIVAWLVVGLPLAWGVMQTVLKAAALFR